MKNAERLTSLGIKLPMDSWALKMKVQKKGIRSADLSVEQQILMRGSMMHF